MHSEKGGHLLCGDILKLFYLLFGDRVELDWLVIAIRTDETCAKKCVVPVEYDCRLVKLGLIKWHKPNLLIS